MEYVIAAAAILDGNYPQAFFDGFKWKMKD